MTIAMIVLPALVPVASAVFFYVFAPMSDLPAWAPLECPSCGRAARVTTVRERLTNAEAQPYQHGDGSSLCTRYGLYAIPTRVDLPEPAPTT